jgi:hypothetical protein
VTEGDSATPDKPHVTRWAEVVATVLLAVSAVATAWASYQASRWHGEQAKAQSRATAARIDSTRAADRADTLTEIDVATFIQWIDARATGNSELEDFYRNRFREEFQPAFEAWLATDPLNADGAPLTPFVMPEYRLADSAEAERLEAEAAAQSARAGTYIQRADNYVLAVVLFAAALFFAGISTRLHQTGLRLAVLGLGCLLFLGTVAWIATFPVSVGVA